MTLRRDRLFKVTATTSILTTTDGSKISKPTREHKEISDMSVMSLNDFSYFLYLCLYMNQNLLMKGSFTKLPLYKFNSSFNNELFSPHL